MRTRHLSTGSSRSLSSLHRKDGGHGATDAPIRVTRAGTNFMFFLLGLIPSLLLFFGQNAHHASPTHETHADLLKKSFAADSVPKPKLLRVADPYRPSLISPQQIDPAYNRTILHLVKSRFMQYQPNLTALGWARLELFKDFCMPSIAQQSTQNFVWLVYTDPDLNGDLLQAILELLAPYPNYYLIKSLSNGMWRGGQAENTTKATVLTGNRAQLEAFIALRNQLPVLETRLDADDALHEGFLEEIQSQATQMLVKEGVMWMYWCVYRELEWTWVGPDGYNDDQKRYGVVEIKDHKTYHQDFCPTVGLTLGYAADTPVDAIYSRRHSVLVERLLTKDEDFCGPGRPGKDCYQMIRKFEFPAFRCRTPTSASMIMTNFSNPYRLKKAAEKKVENLWRGLRDSFDVPRNNVDRANQYLTDNIVEIARDALLGQCTKGHSCSNNARAKLLRVMERYSQNSPSNETGNNI